MSLGRRPSINPELSTRTSESNRFLVLTGVSVTPLTRRVICIRFIDFATLCHRDPSKEVKPSCGEEVTTMQCVLARDQSQRVYNARTYPSYLSLPDQDVAVVVVAKVRSRTLSSALAPLHTTAFTSPCTLASGLQPQTPRHQADPPSPSRRPPAGLRAISLAVSHGSTREHLACPRRPGPYRGSTRLRVCTRPRGAERGGADGGGRSHARD
jgi:hypothetical protein